MILVGSFLRNAHGSELSRVWAVLQARQEYGCFREGYPDLINTLSGFGRCFLVQWLPVLGELSERMVYHHAGIQGTVVAQQIAVLISLQYTSPMVPHFFQQISGDSNQLGERHLAVQGLPLAVHPIVVLTKFLI